MKAIQIHEFGGVEKLRYEEVSMPEIQPDEILIRIYATGINPIDWKVRNGYRKENYHLPLIPGWDVSGVVERAGAEVTEFQEGEEVYARPDTSRNGTYAEYVAVKAGEVARKPKSIDHVHAAAIPLAGLTAWQGLFDYGKLQAGQTVLIHGAAGGVGTLAVQLAKWKGAHVIGTASAKNIDFLKGLGADEVIDYHKENFTDKLSNIDLVFDTIGGETQQRSVEVLKPGGILVTTVAVEAQDAGDAKNIKVENYMAQSYPDQLRQMAELIDQGILKAVISQVLSLEEAAKGQHQSEEGHTRGKIILQVI